MSASPQTQTRTKSQTPGAVTRIDLEIVNGTVDFPEMVGIRVKKWFELDNNPYRNTQRRWGRPDLVDFNSTMSIDDMVSWLEDHGYRVYRWPTGARAFYGDPHPVRSTEQIRRLRDKLKRRKMDGDPLLADIEVYGLDLRFQW